MLDHVAGRLPAPSRVGMIFGAALVCLWGTVVVVDVLGFGDTWLAARGATPAWYQLFEEGSPVEWAQTVAMVGVVVVATWTAARSLEPGLIDTPRASRRLLGWLAAGVAIMLVEDSGNVGERMRNVVALIWSPGPQVLGAVRLPLFALAGAAITWGLVAHRAALARRQGARRLLAAGWGCYAVMGLTAELGNYLVPLYEIVGHWIAVDVLGGRLAPPPGTPGLWSSYEVVMMDFLYEESLELVAVTLLLLGALQLGRSPKSDPHEDGD